MCTAILRLGPAGTVLLAGVRDEFASRAWQPPARYWPAIPDVLGGRDLLAGGTWLAVAPAAQRVACVLNGRGQMAPAATRRSRGTLPLSAAADGKLEAPADLAAFDPFRLLIAEAGRAVLMSWDGVDFTERELGPGLHIVVNSGVVSDTAPGAMTGPADTAAAADTGPGGLTAEQAAAARAREQARIGHFLPRLAARAPQPVPGRTVAAAWGDWLPLLDGDGIPAEDQRALIVRRDFGHGRIWGTTSISLVAITPAGLRYDFTATPGDPAAWYPVPLEPVPPS